MKRFLALLLTVSMVLGLGFLAGASADEPVKLTMFVDAPWWPYSDWSGDMPRWAVEQTGVDFDVQIAADMKQLPMLVASGDLPDVVVTENFSLMANSDICYDWDELIEKYNLDFKLHPAYSYVNQASDGKCYTVMVGWSADYEYDQYPAIACEGRGACVRDDILKVALDELGIDTIRSIEDLEKCFEICKRDYPDVLPYAYCGDWPLDYYIGLLYGCAEAGFVDEGDGTVKLWLDQACRKDLYMKLNEWARKGYISKETYGWSNITTGGEWCTAGKLFCYALSETNAVSQDLNSEKNDLPWRWIGLNDLIPENAAYYQYRAGWRGFFITKNCKDPEAAIRYAAFAVNKPTQYQMMWGFEGEDWNWNEDKTLAIMNYDISADSDFVAQRQLRWGWLGHDGISNNMYKAAQGGKFTEGKAWMKAVTKWEPVCGILMHSLDPESSEYITYNELIQLEKDYATAIIFAETAEEAEAQYDKMMQQAASMGTAHIEEWANELYPKLLAGYEEVRGIGPEGWTK